MTVDWSKYPSFKESEFKCSHTGKCKMRPEFLDILQQIRTIYGRPMAIASGYRDVTHPVESSKASPGAHTYGIAADIRCAGKDAQDLFVIAHSIGIRRIGVEQSLPAASRYLHLDIGDKGYGFPVALWSY